MPLYVPSSSSATIPDNVVTTDSSGRIASSGSLPFRVIKTTLPTGKSRYSLFVLDGGQERVIGFADY